MTDVNIEGHDSDTAVLLLAAAEELDLDPGVVRTTTSGFLVPEEVANKAGLGEEEPKAAKKAPAKKSAAKKTTAKKTAAKKTAPKE